MGTVSGTLMGLATLTLGALGFTAANQEPVASAQGPSTRLSATMNNASMEDVLEWLRRTGVNFVIDAGDPASRARLNVNVNNQPLKDVMDAIASAVGGAWVKHGEVYSLKSRGMFGATAPSIPFDGEPGAFGESFGPKIREHLRDFNEKEMRAFGESLAPKIKEHLRELEEFGPEFEKHFEKFEMELPEMKEFHMPKLPEMPNMKLIMPKMENVDKLMKSLTPTQKELLKSKGHLTPEDLTAAQKELLKGMGGLKGNMRFHKDGEEFSMRAPGEVIIAPPTPLPPGERIEGVPVPMPPGERIGGNPVPLPPDVRIEGVPRPVPPPPARWKELSASLTQSQRELIKKQGHLYDDQLTAAQRRMVHLPEGSSFTLTIKNGKESLTIKSRKQ
jgi:hypothetical protein